MKITYFRIFRSPQREKEQMVNFQWRLRITEEKKLKKHKQKENQKVP